MMAQNITSEFDLDDSYLDGISDVPQIIMDAPQWIPHNECTTIVTSSSPPPLPRYYERYQGYGKPLVGLPNIRLPVVLENILKPHQIDGITFLFQRVHMANSGAVLAHSMGLGKSAQVVALLHLLHQYGGAVGHVLILTPKSTLSSWKSEFLTWATKGGGLSNIPCVACDGTAQENQARISDWRMPGPHGVMLMSPDLFCHSSFAQHRASLHGAVDLLIIDEAHRVRSEKAEFTSSLEGFKTPRRICITGWPLQNNLMEYVHMLEVACPALFKEHAALRNTVQKMVTDLGTRDVTPTAAAAAWDALEADFKKVIEPVVHRRNADVLKAILPTKAVLHEHAIFVGPSNTQKQLLATLSASHEEKFQLFRFAALSSRLANHPDVLYHASQNACKRRSAEDNDGEAESMDSETLHVIPWAEVFEKMSYTPGQKDASSKMCALMSILKTCAECKEKVLVFSQSIGTLDVIEKFLADTPWGPKYVRLDGKCSHAHRAESIRDFNDPNSTARIALISTRAGGLGITMTAATRVVLMDVSWNPCNDGQAIHRAFRIGQTKPVHVYRLILARSMESRLYSLQRNKMFLFFTVIDQAKKDKSMLSDKTRIDKKCLKEMPDETYGTSSAIAATIAALRKTDGHVLNNLHKVTNANLWSIESGHESRQFDVAPEGDLSEHRKRVRDEHRSE